AIGRGGRKALGAEPGDAGRRRDRLVLRRLHDHPGDLGAVRGGRAGDGRAGVRFVRAADRGDDPDRAVLPPVDRHREGRAAVRPDHDPVFHRAGGDGRDAHRRAARRIVGAESSLGGALRRDRREARLPGAGFGGAGGDRRGGAVRRHGAFRAQADLLRVARLRAAGVD
ncbi:hypothetical protein LTR94_032492, partial [Friedmanniomyces endolithicus]